MRGGAFAFYIVTDRFPEKLKRQLQALRAEFHFVDFDLSRLVDSPLSTHAPHLTRATYLRFYLPDLLPDLDRVLYLDCDTAVCGKLQPLWDVEMGNALAAVVEDEGAEGAHLAEFKEGRAQRYFNAGVMLINLALWRAEQTSRELWTCLNAATTSELPYLDQDVLNRTLTGRVVYLDGQYNYQGVRGRVAEQAGTASSVVIAHYVSPLKPWHVHCEHEARYYYIRHMDLMDRMWLGFCRNMRWLLSVETQHGFSLRILGLKLISCSVKLRDEGAVQVKTVRILRIPFYRSRIRLSNQSV